MVFWIGILIGIIFTIASVRRGFYDTWALLFNIVIAAYLGVYLGPSLTTLVPEAWPGYHNAVVMGMTGAGSFAILFGISYIFITNEFRVTFPRAFDILGAGFLGFFGGMLVWSFAAALISLTPLTEIPRMKMLGFEATIEQPGVAYLAFWCDRVHKIVGVEEQSTKEIIGGLLEQAEKITPPSEEGTKKAGVNGKTKPTGEGTKTGTESPEEADEE